MFPSIMETVAVSTSLIHTGRTVNDMFFPWQLACTIWLNVACVKEHWHFDALCQRHTCPILLISQSQLILTLLWQYAHENLDRPRLIFCHKRKNMARPESVDQKLTMPTITPLVPCRIISKSIYVTYIVMRQKVSLGLSKFW